MKKKILAIIGTITILALSTIFIVGIFTSSEIGEKYDDGWEVGEEYQVWDFGDSSICLKEEGKAPLCMREGDILTIDEPINFTAIRIYYPLVAKKIGESTTLYTDASEKYSWLKIEECVKEGDHYSCTTRTEEVKK